MVPYAGRGRGPAVLTREYIKSRGRCRQYFWFDVTGGVRHHGGITGGLHSNSRPYRWHKVGWHNGWHKVTWYHYCPTSATSFDVLPCQDSWDKIDLYRLVSGAPPPGDLTTTKTCSSASRAAEQRPRGARAPLMRPTAPSAARVASASEGGGGEAAAARAAAALAAARRGRRRRTEAAAASGRIRLG